ncbi:MAG: cytochrome oxidase small assembly protein [Rubrivivax sp.]|nr:cytochrome oxidase small assembly protein [Rubrivivax sp.]
MATSAQHRKANLRLALILASAALLFGLGFVAKMVWLGS